MDDLDFVSPSTPKKTGDVSVRTDAAKQPAPKYYDPKLAAKFFGLAGTAETFAAGTQIFSEGDQYTGLFSKGANAYLLLDGEVALTRGGKPLSLVLAGETFGEMAIVSRAPRSANAVARKTCRALSLDEKRFQASLRELPEFALMLLALLAERLQGVAQRVIAARKGAVPPLDNSFALEQKLLDDLKSKLGALAEHSMKSGETIVRQGALGQFMFVITSGTVGISINDVLVEHLGVGGTFGEMGILGNGIRAATATAESDGTWLAVTRDQFLATVKASPALGLALLRAMSERLQHINNVLASYSKG